DYDFDSCRHFSDLRDPHDIGAEAARRAASRTGARQMKTGEATVIFEPRVSRGLVSHLAGAVNGMSVARKTSFLRKNRGDAIFGRDVSIVDEPHLLRGVASRPFDAEGILADDLWLVKDGVLHNWFLDSATAKQLGMETNARANRAGSGTSPGSTNLTMLPGSRRPEEMIADTKHGILVTELIGQGVSLVTGDYSRGASGFLIENGEVTHPVSEITIAGNLRDMFERLEPANDLDKRFGTNAPTIAVEGMTIAGS
ncbi:MAG: metallopeptidase TldD-related protein, partial [Rhizobiaceae bacterium]